jgi:hypothetical protein
MVSFQALALLLGDFGPCAGVVSSKLASSASQTALITPALRPGKRLRLLRRPRASCSLFARLISTSSKWKNLDETSKKRTSKLPHLARLLFYDWMRVGASKPTFPSSHERLGASFDPDTASLLFLGKFTRL